VFRAPAGEEDSMAIGSATATTRQASARYRDFAHTGPETLAGQYLRRFWQPVHVVADLPPGRAKPLRIMSEDFTLYRGESGEPHLVDFRCAHRGTQLSTGWVEGDQLRCFYHGWKYDGAGQCTEQPAEDPAFASKVKIKSYPTEEYLGLVWAYLEKDKPPPMPRYPDFEGEGVLGASSYARPCNYFQNLENGLDNVHVLFVHRGAPSFEGYADWAVPQIAAEESTWGVTERILRPDSSEQLIEGGMPNILFIPPQAIANRGIPVDFLAWRVPIDDESHLTFNVNLAHVTGEAAEQYRQRRGQQPANLSALTIEFSDAVLRGERRVTDFIDHPALVNVQDTVAQMGQGIVADRQHERLGRSDAAVILLRQIWARELRALAEGRPLTQWNRTPPC
jgi:5,5'-dehydrodivanillate O-demethylase